MSNSDSSITPLPPSPPPGTYVTDLHTNDILCGRGSGPNDHIGNINFRELIAARRDTYLQTSSRVEKTRISIEILNHVRSKVPQGRFLERVSGKGKSNPMWVVVTEEKAKEKIKQALRQIRNRPSQAKKPDNAMSENNSNLTPVLPSDAYSNASVLPPQIDTVTSDTTVAASSQFSNGKILPQGSDAPPPRDPSLFPPICVHLAAMRLKKKAATNNAMGPISPLPDEPSPGIVSSVASPMSSQLNADFKNNDFMNMSHRQQAQEQFQKTLGHDEAPITEATLSREIEPQRYTGQAQSSSDISKIGNMTPSEYEHLIDVLANDISSGSMSISEGAIEVDEVISQDVTDATSRLTGDTPNMRRTYEGNINFPKPKVNPYSGLSEQSSMSLDLLTSSMGDVTISDGLDETTNSSQQRIYSRLMSDVSMLEDMLQSGNQDSLSEINQVLNCMDSVVDEC